MSLFEQDVVPPATRSLSFRPERGRRPACLCMVGMISPGGWGLADGGGIVGGLMHFRETYPLRDVFHTPGARSVLIALPRELNMEKAFGCQALYDLDDLKVRNLVPRQVSPLW